MISPFLHVMKIMRIKGSIMFGFIVNIKYTNFDKERCYLQRQFFSRRSHELTWTCFIKKLNKNVSWPLN